MKERDTAAEIALRLELPPECLTDEPRITLRGRHQVTVEQHKGLLGYSHDAVEVNLSRGRMRLMGKDLVVRAMDGETLLVVGTVTAVEYE